MVFLGALREAERAREEARARGLRRGRGGAVGGGGRRGRLPLEQVGRPHPRPLPHPQGEHDARLRPAPALGRQTIGEISLVLFPTFPKPISRPKLS